MIAIKSWSKSSRGELIFSTCAELALVYVLNL